MMKGWVFLALCFVQCVCKPVPSFPLQFSGTLTITAHLIEEDSEYPPRYRSMTVYYDYLQQRARADVEAGYEAQKTYIRLYDSKNEYMVRHPPISDCKRSYLGDLMPYPDIPGAVFVREEVVRNIRCNYFVSQEYETRVHIYMDATSGAPVRLLQESTSGDESVALLTYDYSNVQLGPLDDDLFTLPAPYEHHKCVRHVGGFPYIHVFHHFVRF